MNKKKIKLNNIKLESFVTHFENNTKDTVKGGIILSNPCTFVLCGVTIDCTMNVLCVQTMANCTNDGNCQTNDPTPFCGTTYNQHF